MKSFLVRKLLVVVFLASQTNLFCQKSITDQKNLELLRNTKQDEVRLKLLCEISYAHSKYLPDSGIYFGNEAITLSNKLNNPALKSCAYNSLGWNYLTHFDTQKLKLHLTKHYSLQGKSVHLKKLQAPVPDCCTVAFNKQDTITALAHIHELLTC
jgi:hypothetical protein